MRGSLVVIWPGAHDFSHLHSVVANNVFQRGEHLGVVMGCGADGPGYAHGKQANIKWLLRRDVPCNLG